MRGVLLAGGRGTRLGAASLAVNKHLLPVFDKPLIYHPLSTLMLAGVRDVTIVTNPGDTEVLRQVFEEGEHLGIAISYVVQSEPRGVVHGLLQAASGETAGPVVLILGDNVFHGTEVGLSLSSAYVEDSATVFGVHVPDPSRYAVVEFGPSGEAVSIVEKPEIPLSNWIIPGLYIFPPDVWDVAAQVEPSTRGEYEVADVLSHYLALNRLQVERLSRASFWIDAGTPQSLLAASNHVETMTSMRGEIVSSPEEIAFRQGWIDDEGLRLALARLQGSDYAERLLRLIS